MKYIRKIESIGRWDGSATPIYEGAFCTGDILLTELKTDHNNISVWSFNSEEEKMEALAAIALTRQHIDKLAYVMMDEDEIKKLEIPLVPELGSSDGIVNNEILKRHANLAQIDFWRLGYVAEYIGKLAHEKDDRDQLSKKKVFQLIADNIAKNNIDMRKANESIQASFKHAQEEYIRK